MVDARDVSTPIATSIPLSHNDTSPLIDSTQFHSTVGALQYLLLTRSNIAYTVNRLAQFMQSPHEAHGIAVKRLLHYIKGTVFHGLLICKSSNLQLRAFSKANWARDRHDYKSTSATRAKLDAIITS